MQNDSITSRYGKDLHRLLKSEVYGETIFRVWMRLTFIPERRHKLKRVWRLEAQTKERVLEIFHKEKRKTPPLIPIKLKAAIIGILASFIPWRIIMKMGLDSTAKYLPVFERLEHSCQPEDRDLFAYIVAHERALEAFIRMEIDGQSNNSLGQLEKLLAP